MKISLSCCVCMFVKFIENWQTQEDGFLHIFTKVWQKIDKLSKKIANPSKKNYRKIDTSDC